MPGRVNNNHFFFLRYMYIKNMNDYEKRILISNEKWAKRPSDKRYRPVGQKDLRRAGINYIYRKAPNGSAPG